MPDPNIAPRFLLMFLDFETTDLDQTATTVLETAVALYDPHDDTVVAEHAWLHEVTVTPLEHCVTITGPTGCTAKVLDDVVRAMHADSGLLGELSDPTRPKFTNRHVDDKLAALLDAHRGDNTQIALAGIGVAGFDAAIVRRVFPDTSTRLRGPVADPLVLRLTLASWGITIPSGTDGFGPAAHRALEDVRQGIAQYRWLRAHLSWRPDAASSPSADHDRPPGVNLETMSAADRSQSGGIR